MKRWIIHSLLLGLLIGCSSSAADPATQAPPANVRPASTSAKQVRWKITARNTDNEPVAVRTLVDGVEICASSSDWCETDVQDATPHTLRLEAPGYQVHEEVINVAAKQPELTIVIVLSRADVPKGG